MLELQACSSTCCAIVPALVAFSFTSVKKVHRGPCCSMVGRAAVHKQTIPMNGLRKAEEDAPSVAALDEASAWLSLGN